VPLPQLLLHLSFLVFHLKMVRLLSKEVACIFSTYK
jgi:hypothetical protein